MRQVGYACGIRLDYIAFPTWAIYECEAHDILSAYRLETGKGREWFNCSVGEAMAAVNAARLRYTDGVPERRLCPVDKKILAQ